MRKLLKVGDEIGKCVRCGKEFEPEWCELLKSFDRHCAECQLRNLADGLGMPEIYKGAKLTRDKHSRV